MIAKNRIFLGHCEDFPNFSIIEISDKPHNEYIKLVEKRLNIKNFFVHYSALFTGKIKSHNGKILGASDMMSDMITLGFPEIGYIDEKFQDKRTIFNESMYNINMSEALSIIAFDFNDEAYYKNTAVINTVNKVIVRKLSLHIKASEESKKRWYLSLKERKDLDDTFEYHDQIWKKNWLAWVNQFRDFKDKNKYYIFSLVSEVKDDDVFDKINKAINSKYKSPADSQKENISDYKNKIHALLRSFKNHALNLPFKAPLYIQNCGHYATFEVVSAFRLKNDNNQLGGRYGRYQVTGKCLCGSGYNHSISGYEKKSYHVYPPTDIEYSSQWDEVWDFILKEKIKIYDL